MKNTAEQECVIIQQSKRFPGFLYTELNNYYKYCLKKTINGLWLEFGVYTGDTIKILSQLSPPDTKIYGFDSFEGLPEEWHIGVDNTFRKGKFACNIPRFENTNIQLVVGWFEDTLPKFTEQHPEQCAVIHIDSDIYSSAKTIFNNLRDRIVPGTIILFDELAGNEIYPYDLYAEGEMKAWLEEDFKYEYLAWTHGPQVGVRIL